MSGGGRVVDGNGDEREKRERKRGEGEKQQHHLSLFFSPVALLLSLFDFSLCASFPFLFFNYFNSLSLCSSNPSCPSSSSLLLPLSSLPQCQQAGVTSNTQLEGLIKTLAWLDPRHQEERGG